MSYLQGIVFTSDYSYQKASSPGESHLPGPLRTGLDTLASSGSHYPAVGLIPICQWTKSLGSRLAMFPNQFSAFVLWVFSFLYFLLAHRTKTWFMCRRTGYIWDL